jgi:hypothetical protein
VADLTRSVRRVACGALPAPDERPHERRCRPSV